MVPVIDSGAMSHTDSDMESDDGEKTCNEAGDEFFCDDAIGG